MELNSQKDTLIIKKQERIYQLEKLNEVRSNMLVESNAEIDRLNKAAKKQQIKVLFYQFTTGIMTILTIYLAVR